jgi:hypothetical protein
MEVCDELLPRYPRWISLRYTLDRMLGGSQSKFGFYAEENKFAQLGIEPDRSSRHYNDWAEWTGLRGVVSWNVEFLISNADCLNYSTFAD